MANPKFGTKRQCLSCEAKFYDLRKDPVLCPHCGTTFSPEAFLQAHMPRATAGESEYETAEETTPPVSDDSVLDTDDDDEDTVSLEHLVDTETDDDANGDTTSTINFDDDVDLDDDDDDDDRFLPSEEDE